MFKNRLIVVTILICVLYLCNIGNVCYAGPSLGTWINAATDVSSAKSVMETERDQYHYIQSDLKTLIGEWEDSKTNIGSQRLLSVLAAGGAIVSIASGGSAYPAAYVITVTAAKLMYNEAKYDVSASSYLSSMSVLIYLMDSARSNVDAAYNGGYLSIKAEGIPMATVSDREWTEGYSPEYDAYLDMALAHLNGYKCFNGVDYDNIITLTIEGLTSSVKGGTLKGWYHKNHHEGDQNSKTDHSFDKFMTFDDFVVNPDLPSEYSCKGDGKEMFRTPYEAKYNHITKCGHAEYVFGHDFLHTRSVEQGCGYVWYTCDTDHSNKLDRHKVRRCKKTFTNKDSEESICKYEYRKCLGYTRDHNKSDINPWASRHSDNANIDEEVKIPDTPTTPDDTPQETDVSYACGIHSGASADESSDHQTLITGYSGSFYECQPHTTFGCGHTDLSSNSYTHRSETCPKNSNGKSCNVGSYYACISHTHDYPPTTVACGARSWTGCRVAVSSRTEHQIPCVAGHPYYTCNPKAVAHHATPIACKRSGCNVSITKCQNKGGGGCFSRGKEYKYHDIK